MCLKILIPKSCKTQLGTPDILGFSKTTKYGISDIAYKHLDFPTVGGKSYRSITAINYPPTGRHMTDRQTDRDREKGRVTDWLL